MLHCLILLLLAVCEEPAPLLGEGAHRYRWDADWPQRPEGADFGNTHGGIVIDSEGLIYFNTDTERAVMVFRPDGSFVRAFGADLKGGLHGMALAREGEGDDAREVLYVTHLGRSEVLKLSLEGEILWRRGFPEEAKVYDRREAFRPTGVALGPDGSIYVADGYGLSYVHRFAADGTWIRTFGGLGSEPGRFRTCHGLCVDHRTDPPTLVIADRENGRLQRFDLDGGFVEVIAQGLLRRPCQAVQQGDFLAVPDLAGRVTILDRENRVVCHLGDNPDEGLRAQNGVPREQWRDGVFLSPHSAAWADNGDLYVMDWNFLGRVSRLARVRD